MAETTQNTKKIVQAPKAGETIVIKAMPGQDIVLSDAFEQVDPVLEGSTVLFAFDNGGKVIIDFADLGEVQIPNIVLADGTMLGVDEFLASVAGQKEAALGGENIEPAAGPAAGGTASGGVGSYEDDAGDTIDGVSKLGGLDPRDFTSVTVEPIEASEEEVVPDNVPFTFENPVVLLDDDALANGNPGGLGDDADSVFATGTLGFGYGLDGIGSVLLSTTGLSLPTGFSASVSADGLEMIISQGDTDVLRVTLSDTTSGQYTVEQLAAIDHPAPGASEENLQFTLGYQVTDADGDSAFGTLSVNVDDDTPVLLGEGSEVENPGQGGDISYVGIPGPGEGGNSLVNGLGGPRGFGENFLAANDDGSIQIDVSSIFPEGMNFFGQTYTKFYINNNGNITFNAALGQYTPDQITAGGSPMIAPFFADVDTEGSPGNVSSGGTSTGSNLVWYDFDTDNGVITITWDDTGYYGANTDKVNAFQLRIFDQGGGNFSFEFRYENIDWTTGDASGGTGGLGGTVARAGWTAGDGVNFYELPQSGDQAAILGLESTSNPSTPVDGNWVFNVVGGQVVVGSGPDIIAVEEESVPDDGGVIGIDELGDGYSYTINGTVFDDASWGADGFGGASGLSFNGQTFAAGVTVFWAQDGSFLGTSAAGAAASLIVNADGTYTFTMLDNILLGQNIQGEQIDTLATVSVIGVDGDGDPLNVPLTINVVDDVPAIDLSRAQQEGEEGFEDTPAPTLTTQDAQTDGDPTDSDTDSDSFAGLFSLTSAMGADDDGTAPALAYSLSIGAGLADTGLTSDGLAITLAMDGNDIVGSTTNGAIFRISVSNVQGSVGEVTLTQYAEIDHVGEGLDGNSANNDVNLLGLAAGSIKLTASATIVDGDGDSATDSETVDIGGAFKFEDDVPTVNVGLTTAAAPTLTTQDAQTDGDPTDSDTDSDSFAGLFSLTSAMGADDDGTAPALAYSLSIGAGLADTGLTSDGLAITLAMDGNDIVGSTTNGAIFRISVSNVQGSAGEVTLTQYAEIDHVGEDLDGNSANNDVNLLGLAAGSIKLTASATIVDGDGDSATDSETVDIGGAFKFEDDVPDAGYADYTRLDAAPTPVSVVGNLYYEPGADGLDDVTFDYVNFYDPARIGDFGLQVYNGALTPLTFESKPIYFAVYDGVSYKQFGDGLSQVASADKLYGVTYNNDGTIDSAVFSISLNSNGSYTMTTFEVMDKSSSTITVDLTGGISGGNDGAYFLGVLKDGNDKIEDGTALNNILATPLGSATTINSRSGGLGAGAKGGGDSSLFIHTYNGSNEGVKFDFKGAFDDINQIYTGDRIVNAVTITMGATQSGDENTVMLLARNAAGALVPITGVTSTGGTPAFVDPDNQVAGDEYWTVSGLVAGETFTVSTGGAGFNELEVWYVSGSGFLLSSLSYSYATKGNVIDLAFDYTVTDGDGDTDIGTINLSIDPDATHVTGNHSVSDVNGEVVHGNEVANIITGNIGSDTLYGADGNDTLSGGRGDDVLTGDSGSDTFKYGADDIGHGVDKIADFHVGAIADHGDVLDFTGVLTGANDNNLDKYLQLSNVTHNSDGTTTANLSVDTTGDADGASFTQVATITMTGVDASAGPGDILDDMIANHEIKIG